MSIGELQSNSNEVLLRERMKAIKAGKKGGDCYISCYGGTWGIVQTCADGYNICGDSGWMCSKGDGTPCD